MPVPRSSFSRLRLTTGFTLAEVLVATTLLSGGLAAVAQLVALVSRSTIVSRDISYARTLAAQKLSELAYADLAGLAVSPPDAWMRSVENVEYLDSGGALLAAGGLPAGDAVYVRRWSVTPLPADVTGGVVFQVSAGRLRRQPGGELVDARPFEVARVVGVRTRVVP